MVALAAFFCSSEMPGYLILCRLALATLAPEIRESLCVLYLRDVRIQPRFVTVQAPVFHCSNDWRNLGLSGYVLMIRGSHTFWQGCRRSGVGPILVHHMMPVCPVTGAGHCNNLLP